MRVNEGGLDGFGGDIDGIGGLVRGEDLGKRRLELGIGRVSGSTRQRQTCGRLPPEADVPHHERELGAWIG